MSLEIYKKAGIESLKYFFAKAVPAFFSFIGIIVYTKIFPPDEYGSYALVQTYLNFLAIFPSTIVGNSALRFFIPYKEKMKLNLYYSTLALIYLVFVGVVAFLLSFFVLNGHLSPILLKLYILSHIEIVLLGIFTVSLAVLLASFKSGHYLLFSIIFSGARIPMVLLMVFLLKLRVESILLSSILTLIILLPVVISSLPYLGGIKLNGEVKRCARELIFYGFPLGILGISNWALQYANRYIISLFYSSTEVAYYSVALNFSQIAILTILSGILLQTSPAVIHIFETEGKNKAGDYVTTMAWWSIVIGIPVVLFFSVMSGEILFTFTRKEYLVVSGLVFPLSLSSLMAHLAYIYNKGFELSGKTSLTALYFGLSAVVSVVLCFLLVPRLNVMGAAIANLISFILAFVIVYLRGRMFLPFGFPVKSLLWGIILGGVVFALSSGIKLITANYITRLFLALTINFLLLLPIVFRFRKKIFATNIMREYDRYER